MAQKANLSLKNKFPYISVIDKASNFKFSALLRFAKAHQKSQNLGVFLQYLHND